MAQNIRPELRYLSKYRDTHIRYNETLQVGGLTCTVVTRELLSTAYKIYHIESSQVSLSSELV